MLMFPFQTPLTFTSVTDVIQKGSTNISNIDVSLKPAGIFLW